jgi:hypothetical protein
LAVRTVSADGIRTSGSGTFADVAGPRWREPTICTGCGILVDPTRPGCECGAAYPATPITALTQPDNGYFVAVKVAFQCNACGYQGPLNHIEDGDGVTCVKCAVEQHFDSSWHEIAQFAHAVGDLGTPGAEGRFPDPEIRIDQPKPHAALGSGRPWEVGPQVHATLGNPLCRACKAPVTVVAKTPALTTECSHCKAKRSYERAVAKRYKLAGVIADEHEVGRRDVTFATNHGALIITCPNCNGALEIAAAEGGVTCRYCSAPCRISTKAHAQAGHKETPTKVWWFYFDTPSAARRQLVTMAGRERGAKAKQREREDLQRQQIWAENARREAVEQEKAAAARADARSDKIAIVIVVVIVLLAGGGIAAWRLLLR